MVVSAMHTALWPMAKLARFTVVLSVILLVVRAGGSWRNGSRYGFYRSMGGGGESRRVFGGGVAEAGAAPGAVALLDRYWAARCSGTVVAARWALTAAHCVSPRIAYVRYNTRRPAAPHGDVAPVHYLYRHPGYKVVQEDEGRGPDVTLLHHDIGLVRTRVDLRLAAAPPLDPLVAMKLYNPSDLKNEEIQVFGFGRTERSLLGEELFTVRLQLVFCERGSWVHCVCGVAAGARAGGGGAAGVCSGDSGGPVMYRGAQVGVTSMGPMECAAGGGAAGGGAAGGGGGTSVFTSLYPYAALVNATILDTEAALRMHRVSRAPRAPRRPAHAPSLATLVALLLSAR